MTKWLAILAAGFPLLALTGAVFIRQLKRRTPVDRPPLEENLLRPPGYSASRAIENCWRQFVGHCFGLGICSVGLGLITLPMFESEKPSQYAPSFSLVAVGGAIFMWLAWRKAVAIGPLRLGLLGEQAVAEHLQKLSRKGYEVFHDVPGGGRWNIDHVVIGPGGVFAVVTKCPAKKPAANDLAEHEAVFDGKTIHFPWCTDERSVTQAQRNMKWLGKWLLKGVGEQMTVQPIIALPGWSVKENPDSIVKVLSGKQLPEYIGNEPARLSEQVIQQIVNQLDERCRDVEF